MSGFMPRHIEQPATRQSKPASRKMRSRPSASAWALTCCDPGTTIADTLEATLPPAAASAGAPPGRGLGFAVLCPGDAHRGHAGGHPATGDDPGGGPQVADAGVRARAD